MRSLQNILIVFFVITFALAVGGCTKKINPRYSLSDAEKKFLEICRKEHKLPVQLFEAENTIWIYLPMEEDLVNYHGVRKDDRSKSRKQFSINTLEGDFKDQQYRFLLDISDGIKTSKDPGYKSDASEAFIRNRLLIYGAIMQCFFDINELPGDRHFVDKARDEKRQKMLESYIPKEKAPEFFVVVVANVKNGVAYKTVFNLNDYKQYRSEVLTPEEYNLREVSELYGNDKLVGDMEGKSLDIKPITWPWFLIEQIKNRVGFKFTRSDFPPKSDIIIEIASIVADTFRYYQYGDYSAVLIKDLRVPTSYHFEKPQIISFEQTQEVARPAELKVRYLSAPGQTIAP